MFAKEALALLQIYCNELCDVLYSVNSAQYDSPACNADVKYAT